ncbi:MAG: response regulator [Roseateles sp.]
MSDDTLRRVMCIEDDEDIRLLLELSLRDLGGYELLCCAGGEEGLRSAPEFRPQLVLLDVMMPGLSGPETLQALRRLPGMEQVPVVFLTAKAMPAELERLLNLGATGLIVKPFEALTLAQDIRPFWEFGRGPKP